MNIEEQREITIEQGMSAVRADYYATIAALAEDIAKDVQKGEITRSDALQDLIAETCDGSYYAIYTHASLRALIASDNWLAAEDDLGDFSEVASGAKSLSDVLSRYVYYAMIRDVSYCIEHAHDVDLNDPRVQDDGPTLTRRA